MSSKLKNVFIPVLCFQMAVLPGCSSVSGSRAPANASADADQSDDLMRRAGGELLVGSLNTLKRQGWRAFDLTNGNELIDETAASKIQLKKDRFADLMIRRDGIPFVVRITVQKPEAGSGFNFTMATYEFKNPIDQVRMTTSELFALKPTNTFLEKVDLSSFETVEEMALNLKGVTQRAQASLMASADTPLKELNMYVVGVAFIGFAAVAMIFGTAVGGMHYFPSPKEAKIALGICALLVLAVELKVILDAKGTAKKYRDSLR